MFWLQGFQAIVDMKTDYPSTSRETIIIRTGHTVLVLLSIYERNHRWMFMYLEPCSHNCSEGQPKSKHREHQPTQEKMLLLRWTSPESSTQVLQEIYPGQTELQWSKQLGHEIIPNRLLAFWNAGSIKHLKAWPMTTDAFLGTIPLLVLTPDCVPHLRLKNSNEW